MKLLYLKFTLIPLSFLILRAPGTVYRVCEYLGLLDSHSVAWNFVMAVGDSSQGWANALIFIASSPHLQECLGGAWHRLCLDCGGDEVPVVPCMLWARCVSLRLRCI